MGEFQVSCGGQEIATTLSAFVDSKVGDNIVIKGILSRENIKGNSMIFYGKQSEISVYLDGELMTESERDRITPFPVAPR